jgi:Uma2 family endonuclease
MLYVSPWPTLSHDLLEKWVWRKLEAYAATRPDLINFISTGCRFLVPDRPGDTAPSPDLAVYQNLPLYLPDDQLDWRYFSPFLVAEVMSADSVEKDDVRNVELFWQTPSIQEYWLFDARISWKKPSLKVYRRLVRAWQIIEVEPGGTYTTRLLPGFELVLDRGK